ncbi:hypothetical protein [Cnuella takakiae]|uniref:hypothetical protein n=1 Tax=Cnuella takakiae TaxID=1302690 RepID=UPI0009FB4BC3
MGALAARAYALELVQGRATEARVQLCYAPGINEPLDVSICCNRKLHDDPRARFQVDAMRWQVAAGVLAYTMDVIGSFYANQHSAILAPPAPAQKPTPSS